MIINITIKYDDVLFATLTAAVLMFMAALHTIPRIDLYSQGNSFAELSRNPFIIHDGNALHYRMFFPFMSWLFGLSGNGVAISSLIFAFLVLFTITLGVRRRGLPKIMAFLFAAVFAFSITTQFTLVYGGFADSLLYLLIVIALFSPQQKYIFWTALTLALYTHESVALLFPFFILYRADDAHITRANLFRFIFREVLMALIIMFVPYIVYRLWVNAGMTSDILTNGQNGSQMYCVLKSLQNPLYCIREVNLLGPLLFWAIYGSYRIFLFVPVMATLQHIRHKSYRRILQYVAIFCAFLFSFPLNLDTTRVIGIMLIPLLILALLDISTNKKFLSLLTVGVIINLLLPKTYAITGTLRYFIGLPDIWKTFFLKHYDQVDIIFGRMMFIPKIFLLQSIIATGICLILISFLISKKHPLKKEEALDPLNFEKQKQQLSAFGKKHHTGIFFTAAAIFLIILNQWLLPTTDEYFYSLIVKAFSAAWQGRLAWHNIVTEHTALIPLLALLWQKISHSSQFPVSRLPIILFSLGAIAFIFAICGEIASKKEKIWSGYILLLIPGFWIFSVRFMLDIPSLFAISFFIYVLLKKKSIALHASSLLLILLTKEYYFYATIALIIPIYILDALMSKKNKLLGLLKAGTKTVLVYLPSLITIFVLINFNIFPYPRLLETSLADLFGDYYRQANKETLLVYQKINPTKITTTARVSLDQKDQQNPPSTTPSKASINEKINSITLKEETPTGLIKNKNEEIQRASGLKKIWLISKYNFSESDINILIFPLVWLGIIESIKKIKQNTRKTYPKIRGDIIILLLFSIFAYFNYHQATAIHGFRIALPMMISIVAYAVLGAKALLEKNSKTYRVLFIIGFLGSLIIYWFQIRDVQYGSLLATSAIARLLAIKPYLFMLIFVGLAVFLLRFSKIKNERKWVWLGGVVLLLFSLKFLPFALENQLMRLEYEYDYKLWAATPALKIIQSADKKIAGNIHPYRLQYYSDDPYIENWNTYPTTRYWTKLYDRKYYRFPINEQLINELKNNNIEYFLLVHENFQSAEVETFQDIVKKNPTTLGKIMVEREKGKTVWELYKVHLTEKTTAKAK